MFAISHTPTEVHHQIFGNLFYAILVQNLTVTSNEHCWMQKRNSIKVKFTVRDTDVTSNILLETNFFQCILHRRHLSRRWYRCSGQAVTLVINFDPSFANFGEKRLVGKHWISLQVMKILLSNLRICLFERWTLGWYVGFDGIPQV